MRNNYTTLEGGKTTVVFANGKGEVHNVLIDTEDFDRITSHGTWVVAYEDVDKVGRVVAGNPSVPLHRVILDYYGNKVIDHINRNPLDNRKENLRIVSVSENGQNRSLNKNSSTGVRGLTWCKISNKYRARTQINGKRITIGTYNTIQEGKKAIEEYRKKHTASID